MTMRVLLGVSLVVIVVGSIARCIILGGPRLPIRPCDERPPATYGQFCLVPRVSTVVWHLFYCTDVKCGVMKIPISLKKVHTKFCKFIFGVSKCSHNMPIYGELGRYPLSITIKQRMVCYWTRILKSNQHKLNKRSCIKSYIITFIAKIFTRQAGLNIFIQFFRIMA